MTTKQMRDLAAQYQARAEALITAADLIDTHTVNGKQATIHSQLSKAQALRTAQSPADEPESEDKAERRQQLLAALMTPGAFYTIKQVHAYFTEHDIAVSKSTIAHDLTHFGATRVGHASQSRWVQRIKGQKLPRRPEPIKATRKRTAKALAQIAKHDDGVTAQEAHALLKNHGVLAAAGYLKRENDRYVRTNKPFIP